MWFRYGNWNIQWQVALPVMLLLSILVKPITHMIIVILLSVTLRYDGSSRFGKIIQAFGSNSSRHSFFKVESWGSIYGENKRVVCLIWNYASDGDKQVIRKRPILLHIHFYVTDYGMGDPTWTSFEWYFMTWQEKAVLLLPSVIRVQQGNPDLKWENDSNQYYLAWFWLLIRSYMVLLNIISRKTKTLLVQPPYLGIIEKEVIAGVQWCFNGKTRFYELS